MTYTQWNNQAPTSAYVAIVKSNGGIIWRALKTTDTTYDDGSVYTHTTRLPVDAYSYYFQFVVSGVTVKTEKVSGPTVK